MSITITFTTFLFSTKPQQPITSTPPNHLFSPIALCSCHCLKCPQWVCSPLPVPKSGCVRGVMMCCGHVHWDCLVAAEQDGTTEVILQPSSLLSPAMSSSLLYLFLRMELLLRLPAHCYIRSKWVNKFKNSWPGNICSIGSHDTFPLEKYTLLR